MAALPMKWSDMNDDDGNADDISAFVEIDGDIKTTVAFVTTPEEGTVKVVTKKRVCKTSTRRSETAAEMKRRMQLGAGTFQDYTSGFDREVYMEIPRNMRNLNDDMEEDFISSNWKDNVKEKFNLLRSLDGNPTAEMESRLATIETLANMEETTAPILQRYDARAARLANKDECIIRVTNLSEETDDEDLANLFGKIGKVDRIFLARDKDTKVSKGYAFITYSDRANAEKAIALLDRHGHDNLLLRVEWAKPPIKTRE